VHLPHQQSNCESEQKKQLILNNALQKAKESHCNEKRKAKPEPQCLQLESYDENYYQPKQGQEYQNVYQTEEEYDIHVQDDNQKEEVPRQRYWLRKIKRYFKRIQNPLWRY
jgi:hypothetical protein